MIVDRYTAEFKEQREAREAQAEVEAGEAARLNREARARYEASLEAERAAKNAEADARLEEALAPERDRLKRGWLAAHPGKTARDFTECAWPLLRANLVEQLEAAEGARMRASLRARYNF